MQMKAKRLVMDTDYHDLTYCHKGEPSDLDRLFDNMAAAGFDAISSPVTKYACAMHTSLNVRTL
jgi:hypothetical protein